MKSFIHAFRIIILLIIILLSSCKKENNIKLPIVGIESITQITDSSAIVSCNVTSDGGIPVTERGVCWSKISGPTIDSLKKIVGAGTGSFTCDITNLSAMTKYYVKAYAINSKGTAYSGQILFYTYVSDFEGNIYHFVKIGYQEWMLENLKSTKYNDGEEIPLVEEGDKWADLLSPGYCWYANDEQANKNKFGALYNWYTVNTGKLCPLGLHVPTDEEWTILTNYLTYHGYGYGGVGDYIAKSIASKSGWCTNNTPFNVGCNQADNNSSGFTALPGGIRSIDGSFIWINETCYWWASTEGDASTAWNRYIHCSTAFVFRQSYLKSHGFFVRCLKD